MPTPLRFGADPAHTTSQSRALTAKSVQPARRSGRAEGQCGMWNAGSHYRGLYTLLTTWRQAGIKSAAEELPDAVDRNFLLSDVEPRHALAHGAQQIRGYRPDAARHAIGRQYFLAARAINRGYIADLCALHVCDIDRGHVHGDDADDRHELPAQQHVPAISQRSVNSVSVPRGQNADARRSFCHKRRVVSDSRALWNITQTDDPRTKAHHRLQRQPHFGFLALFSRIVARMVAI